MRERDEREMRERDEREMRQRDEREMKEEVMMMTMTMPMTTGSTKMILANS